MQLLYTSILTLLLYLPSNAALANDDVWLYPMNSKAIPFSSLHGKWVFFHYWASWCTLCLDEISTLNQFYKTHQKEPLLLFAVNYDGYSTEEQKALISSVNIQYPSLGIDPASVLHLGNIRGLPATFVFNPNGKLHDILYGQQNLSSLNAYYKTLKTAQEQPLKPRVYIPSA